MTEMQIEHYGKLIGDVSAVAIATLQTTLIIALAAFLLVRATRVWSNNPNALPHATRRAIIICVALAPFVHWRYWRLGETAHGTAGLGVFVDMLSLIAFVIFLAAWTLGVVVRKVRRE